MSSGLHILVADDDPALLRTVAEALEQSGALVTRATSGAELIEALGDDGPFDLIVTDIAMPWMTGLQAMQSSRYAGLGTPVIVMTALEDATLSACVRALDGTTAFLRKPFGLAELEATVARLLPRSEHHASI
jgi:CheY-like chemotaxis protein